MREGAVTVAESPIGRSDECRRIEAFLSELDDGRGGVLLLEGDGGTGKTTLAEWALEQAEQRGMVALTGRSWEMSQSVPYEPVVAAVGRFLRSVSGTERQRLSAGLSSLATLFDGLDLEAAPSGADDLSRARLHDAVATLLSRIAEERPVVFYLDDLQWCDVSTLELLQFVCRDFPFVRMGLIVTLRPGDADDRPDVRRFLSPLRRSTYCSSLTVRNLDRAQTIELLTRRLGGLPPERLVDLVWARSIGTPLLIHEMVADLSERGVLQRVEHGWTLTDTDPPLPRAAADLIYNRVERASASERSLLEILAVADEPTTLAVLVAVSGLDVGEVEDLLGRLIAHRLAAEVSEVGSEPRWHTEHPIIAHVVAAGLDLLVRQRLHRQLLAASPDAPVGRRARHVIGGGPPIDLVAATKTLIEAAELAFQQGASAQASINFEAAERFAESIDDPPISGALLLRIHQGLGRTLVRMRRADSAIAALEKAWERAVAEDLVDEQIRAIASIDSGTFLAGDHSEVVLERLGRLAERFEAAEDWDRLTEIRFQQFLIISRSGLDSTTAHLVASLELLERRQVGARARRMLELMHISELISRRNGRPGNELIGRLLELTEGNEDWDLRRRAGLLALELAGYIGRPEIVEAAIKRTRAVESEVGERPNWRIPIQRVMSAVYDGQELGDFDELLLVGQVERAQALIAVVEALQHRYRHGPEAAEAFLDDRLGSTPRGEAVAQTYALLGRVLLSEGSERFVQRAKAVLDGPVAPELVRVFAVALFDHAAMLALSAAHDDFEAADFLEAEVADAGKRDRPRNLLDAWSAVARSHRASGAARAELLLEAAQCFDECERRLEAAHRRIEAAEADCASVPEELIADAARFARECGATWVADRAAAVAPEHAPAETPPVPDDGLTNREWEVANQVARGLTNREVAQELFISIRTVTSHLDHIYTKLGFSSRQELTSYVRESRSIT